MKKERKTKKSGRKKENKIPFHHRPDGMSVEKWQIALRRQFVQSNDFQITKISEEIVYADYQVYNPTTKNGYKVALRSPDHRGDNYCDCYDFKISRLGTCKHIEAVLLHIAKKRLKKHLKTPVERSYSSVYVDYRQGKNVLLRVGVDHMEEFLKLSMDYFDDHFYLTETGMRKFEVFLHKARTIDPNFRCYDDALEYVLEQREYLRRLQKLSLSAPKPPEKFLEGLVKTALFPYQTHGVLFAFQHGRVILGDEMGLGKTIQAIAATELFRREAGVNKVLVLTPTSLKYQWKSEIEKFTDRDAKVIEGNALHRQREHVEGTADYHIASYHSALFDRTAMDAADYQLIILDEAQRIKNWRTKIAQSVRKIRTRYVLVLTGTPVENNLEELYGLVQFVDPFALGPRHLFFPRYQTTDHNGRVIGYENLGEIRQLLAHRLIRRTKKQVLTQLPKRTDKNLVVPMTQPQREMHREYADQVAKLVHKWQKMKFLDEQDRQKLLKFLNMMRMVCDSTYILDQSTNFQTKVDELRNILFEILEMESEKVVVFSQWVKMTDLVAKELVEMEVGFRYLHGGIPGKDRGALYTDFNNDPNVRIFLSTDAGGVGLNLQAAAWVINLDIPWNPGTLEQRIGRIYRLGQEKPVNIINLIAQGTIEHNLLGVLQFKKGMAAGVLDDGEDAIFMGDSKFKQFMASVETITKDINQFSPNDMSEDEPEPLVAAHEVDISDDDALPGLAAVEEPPLPDPDTLPQTPQEHKPRPEHSHQEIPDPENLVKNGLHFFQQLANTIQDPQATRKLVQSIVQKDEQTGQTYIRLPVENEQTVTQVVQALGALFSAFSGTIKP